MKKIMLLFAALIITVAVSAQKNAFVNTETIFTSIPEYSKALEDIDALAKKYQAEIDAEYDKIGEMFDRYQAQKSNLSEAGRKQVEDSIIALESDLEKKQEGYFGSDGEIMKKRMEKIKPIQDKVFAAIDSIASSKGYDMITDVSNNPSVVYYNKNLDISNDVLKSLGIKK